LDDSRWELEIAINVVSTQHWTHVALFLGVANTPSGGFCYSAIWRRVAYNVTNPVVTKEPSAFIFSAL
jgi:hypothetical protein